MWVNAAECQTLNSQSLWTFHNLCSNTGTVGIRWNRHGRGRVKKKSYAFCIVTNVNVESLGRWNQISASFPLARTLALVLKPGCQNNSECEYCPSFGSVQSSPTVRRCFVKSEVGFSGGFLDGNLPPPSSFLVVTVNTQGNSVRTQR